MPTPLVTRLNATFLPLHDRFREIFGDAEVCLYGEGYGAGIQKGGCYRQDQDFVLFDIKIRDLWLGRDDVMDVANKLAIEAVPIIGSGTLSQAVEKVRVGFESQWVNFQAEGIVARPSVELLRRNGERVITKIKCCDFVR